MRKPKQPIPNDLAAKVYARDGYVCRYCGNTKGPFHIDHVYPESKGGEMTANNLVVACKKCNLRKRAKVGVWPKPPDYFDQIERGNNLQERLSSGSPILLPLIAALGTVIVSAEPLAGYQFPYEIRVVGMLMLAAGVTGDIVWGLKR